MSWEEICLGEIAKSVKSGGTPKTSNPDFYGGEIPWVKTKEVNFNRIYKSETKITLEGLNKSSAKMIEERSILIAMYGNGDTAGRCAINYIPVSTNQACCNFTFKAEKCYPEFMFYLISDHYKDFVHLKSGGAQLNLNGQRLKEFVVKLPPLQTQKKIASILSAYDDLIENNLRRIKLLEEAAQHIYNEWFVHFRFPNHEQTKMDKETGLPNGWEKMRLIDVLELKRGYDLPTKNRKGGSIPVVAATGIVGWHNEEKIAEKGITTGRSGTIGKVLLHYKSFWALNTTLYIKTLTGISLEFAYYLLKDLNLKQYAGGAAVPSLNRNVVHEVEVIIPTSELLKDFTNNALSFFRQIKKLEDFNSQLREARDILLPRLMNQTITV